MGQSFADDDDETVVYSSPVPSDFSSDDDDRDSTSRDYANGPRDRHGDFSDVDDEATYLLPEGAAKSLASSEASSEASVEMRSGSGRAQALSEDGQPIVSRAPRIGDDDEEEDTLTMAVPPELLAGKPRPKPKPRSPQHGHRPSLVDEVTPPPVKNVRSLASLPGPELDVHDYTMSSPNIVRMSFQPRKDGTAPEARNATIADDNAFATSTMGSEDAHLLGQLTVDAPEDATVYVDGVERGKGSVTVVELDRFTHYIVRVHRPGHRPWSTSITLDGQVEASVVPELVKR